MSVAIEIENRRRPADTPQRPVYAWSDALYHQRRPGVLPMLRRLRARIASRSLPLPAPGAVDAAYLREAHHNTYGRPWALGRYQLDYLVERGMKPSDRLLDFGCGSGRFAVWAIEYLEAERYFGVDCHEESLEALTRYEIPLRRLETKSPRVLRDDSFGVARFGVEFDWVMDFYSSRHLEDAMLPAYYERVAACMAPGGRLLCSPKPRLSDEELSAYGLRITHQGRQACPLLSGHDFEDWNDWWELEKSP